MGSTYLSVLQQGSAKNTDDGCDRRKIMEPSTTKQRGRADPLSDSEHEQGPRRTKGIKKIQRGSKEEDNAGQLRQSAWTVKPQKKWTYKQKIKLLFS